MKKVTVTIEDEVKTEIERQAEADGRSFAAFLRRFLKSHFDVPQILVKPPSPSVPTSGGPIVVVPYVVPAPVPGAMEVRCAASEPKSVDEMLAGTGIAVGPLTQAVEQAAAKFTADPASALYPPGFDKTSWEALTSEQQALHIRPNPLA